jgi:hypothetical protein
MDFGPECIDAKLVAELVESRGASPESMKS